jgi:hypothetical protein
LSNRENIHKNLVQFKQRYWFARLVQGVLIFSGTGLVFFGVVALLEYASWLSTAQRTALFLLTLSIELALFIIYLGWPLLQLLLGGKKLSDRNAAQIIGSKLEGVGDKLLNYLELQSTPTTELIDAGIEQKGRVLVGFPFYKAVSFAGLKPFLLFLIPPAIMLAFLLSGNRWHMLSEGAERLINFNTEYKKVLPFTFTILSPLQIEEGSDYELRLELKGKIIPDQIVLQSSLGNQVLQRQGGNLFSTTFSDCFRDIEFRILYEEVESDAYVVGVVKKPVIGRVTIDVIPPAYTGVASFTVDNLREIDAPQGSVVGIRFAIKNANNVVLISEDGGLTDTLSVLEGSGFARLKVARKTIVAAFAEQMRLGDVTVNAIKDLAPGLTVIADSSAGRLDVGIAASDDYGIVKAGVIFIGNDGSQTQLELPIKGGLVGTSFALTAIEASQLKEIQVRVSDQLTTVSRVIDLAKFRVLDQTSSELLEAAGNEMRMLKMNQDNSKPNSKSSSKKKKDIEKEAEELKEVAEKLSEKDSVQFERFRQLSEEIEDMLKKMDKSLPLAKQELQEAKLEELLKQLEQEWAILNAIEQLKRLDDALEKSPFAEEKVMESLDDAEKNLEKVLKEDKQKQIDWEIFKELEKSNSELKQNEDDKNGEEKAEGKQDEEDVNPKSEELKEEMKHDSDALKDQLSKMSDAMMMEAMEKNIELLRRLELRALKASLKQEQVYNQTQTSREVENSAVGSQKEIIQASVVILDSLTHATVTDEQLAVVLRKNVELLDQHIKNLSNLQDITYSGLVSGQRYLQYGLNDLASILYDILKSESQSLQSMMAGEGQCKNPKPGKGKKKSLSQQQKELGEKMGKKKGKGESEGQPGKKGRQSLSHGELLELIKGQEEIINGFKKTGGNKPGEIEALDEMNKQLDDLLKNNIDKAIARNKEIEDKLILIEKSENQKKEDDNKRKSQENKLDYEALRISIFVEYLTNIQTSSGVVNLPALKQYYTVKWVKAGQ